MNEMFFFILQITELNAGVENVKAEQKRSRNNITYYHQILIFFYWMDVYSDYIQWYLYPSTNSALLNQQILKIQPKLLLRVTCKPQLRVSAMKTFYFGVLLLFLLWRIWLNTFLTCIRDIDLLECLLYVYLDCMVIFFFFEITYFLNCMSEYCCKEGFQDWDWNAFCAWLGGRWTHDLQFNTKNRTIVSLQNCYSRTSSDRHLHNMCSSISGTVHLHC